jgi:EmrB/QacA subfamily drug resistance transporter
MAMLESPALPTESEEFPTQSNPRLRLLIPMVVGIAFLMEQLDSTIIVTAIPQMAEGLATTPLKLNLAITAYVLTLAVFIPVSGWFADRFGARQIFALSLLIFTVSSACCGVAQNFETLLIMRIFQGLGGAMMTPVGRLILLRSFPRRDLVTAMTYMSLPAIIGPMIGPLLGGVLAQYLNWRWIFYVNIPFGLLGMVLALRFVSDVRGNRAVKFDCVGFLIVGAGAALLQFGIENIGRPIINMPWTVVVLVTAVLLLLAFGWHARRISDPAIDLTLFRLRSFKVGTLAGGICRLGINGVAFLLPLMLQVGFGMGPITSGSLTFVSALSVLFVRPISRQTLRLFGFGRVLFWSAVAASILIAGFALIGPQTPHVVIVAYVFVFGLTRASQFMSSNTLSYADMPPAQLSSATSLGGVLQQLSISFGVSLGAMFLGLVSHQGSTLTPDDFHRVFLMMAIIPLLSLPGFLFLRADDGLEVSQYRRRIS